MYLCNVCTPIKYNRLKKSITNSIQTEQNNSLQGHSKFRPQLLKFCHHAVGDVGRTLCIDTVHHALDDVQLVLDGKVDEVRVDEHVIGRTELRVVLEVERGGWLGTVKEI